MLTYPLHGTDLGITQESIDAGKVNVVYNYKDPLSMVNTAFFSWLHRLRVRQQGGVREYRRHGPDSDVLGCGRQAGKAAGPG